MDDFLTAKRFDELTVELEELKTTRRLEVAENLRNAKDLGDLSENAEYIEAREEQGRVEGSILELEETLKNATIIKEGKSRGVVDVGSTVDVLTNGKKVKFFIVGTNEAKPEDGFISNQSPLGRELIGKKIEETVVVDAPNGKVQYKILKIT